MSTIKTYWEVAIREYRLGDKKNFELLLLVNAPRIYLYKILRGLVQRWAYSAYICWEQVGFWLDEPYKKTDKNGDIYGEPSRHGTIR